MGSTSCQEVNVNDLRARLGRFYNEIANERAWYRSRISQLTTRKRDTPMMKINVGYREAGTTEEENILP